MKPFTINFRKSEKGKPETYPPDGYVMAYAEVGLAFSFSYSNIVLAQITTEECEDGGNWRPIKFVEFKVHGGSAHCLEDIDLYWCPDTEWDKALCDLIGEEYDPANYKYLN